MTLTMIQTVVRTTAGVKRPDADTERDMHTHAWILSLTSVCACMQASRDERVLVQICSTFSICRRALFARMHSMLALKCPRMAQHLG